MRDPAPWQRRYDRLLAMAVVFGIASQYLFVGKSFGLSIPLFVLGFYGLYFYSMKGRFGGFDKWQGQSKTGWLLFVPIAMLSLSYVFFANYLFWWLNIPALFLLIVIQTMLLTRGGSQPWNRPVFYSELLYQWMIKPLEHVPVPFGMVAEKLRIGKSSPARKGPWGKIALGLLIAAPLLLIIVSLLGSADSIFMSWINSIPSLFDSRFAGEGFLRVFTAVFIAIYVFCYLWGLMFPRKPKPQPDFGPEFGRVAELPSEKAAIGADPVIASTVLVCINLVYVLFAAVQFTYLFGAAEGLLPAGTAYAEYARQGFAELVMVAILNIGLLLLGLHYISPGGKGMDALRRILLTLLMLSSLVMLVSAYSRLSLYEDAYGYTQLRLLVHGFMIMLGVWMAVALARIWYGRFSLAKIYIAIAVASYVVMNYANLDARIADNNIARYEESGKIDFSYLEMLSPDAAPSLLAFSEKYPDLLTLSNVVKELKLEARNERRTTWPSWNLSYHRLME
ncbi:DUF4153 domain-containing protein [Paenibacillus sp. CAU 1782]